MSTLRARIASALWVGLGMLACLSPHAATLGPVQGKVLSVRNPRVAERVQVEADYDPTVRAWLQQEGQPDYILVESRALLRFFYIQKDEMVVFSRMFRPVSEREVVPGINAVYNRNFSNEDREALAAVRYGRAGMKMPSQLAPERSSAPRGEVPAAPPDF